MAASHFDSSFPDRRDLASPVFAANALGLSIPSLNENFIEEPNFNTVPETPLAFQDVSSPHEMHSPFIVNSSPSVNPVSINDVYTCVHQRPYLSQLDTGIALTVSPHHLMQKDLVPLHSTQSSPGMIATQPAIVEPPSSWTSNYSYTPSPMIHRMPMNPPISPHQLSPFLPSPASQYSVASPNLHPLTPLSPNSSIMGESPHYPLYHFSPVPSMGQSSPLPVSPLPNPPQLYEDIYGPPIPQTTYKPPTASDRRRYIDDVELEPPVVFETNDRSSPGFSLGDALKSCFINLKGRDDLMFVNRGPSISIRLQWAGYQPWSRQIPTRDFKSTPGPITRSKLSRSVAKSIQRFIDEQEHTQVEPAHERWRVGTGHITIDDLILVQLRHVSMGSWQAELRLRQRRA